MKNTINILHTEWSDGWGGQEIIILPELNTVVVFTGGNYTSNVKVFDVLEDYIIPAIK